MVPTFLRPFLSRILAPFITLLLSWLINKGIDFGPGAGEEFTEMGVMAGMAIFIAVNAIIHKSIDKKVNPSDAASDPLVKAGNVEDKQINRAASDGVVR